MLNPFFLQTQSLYQPSFLNQSSYNFLVNPTYLLAQQQAIQRDFSNALLYQRQLQYQIQAGNLYLAERAKNPYYHKDFNPGFPFESERDANTRCTSLLSDATSVEHSCCEVRENELNFQIGSAKTEETPKMVEVKALRAQISEMLNLFLSEFGNVDKEEIDRHRKKYSHNHSLEKVFDALRAKFTSAAKCREDMVRFILRKAITFLRDEIRDKQGINAKSASLVLCKRYFDVKLDEEVMKEVHVENDGELLGFLLPYKKNSRNKTANSRFIKEIFASEAFYQDYKNYLAKLEGILESENQKKIEKFSNFLVECVLENSLHKIKEFKRLPWLQVWIQNTKNIAFDLPNSRKPSHTKSTIKDAKKLKQCH